jgi:hypothetical protein
MKKQKIKTLSFRVYGILDKNKKKIIKVSLIKDEIQLDIDLDNHKGNLSLCIFNIETEITL